MNIMIGKLKLHLIGILVEEGSRKRNKKLKKLITEISRNVVPIIPGRTNKRCKIMKATKYPKQKRRAL